ncbi:2,3-bisphosphoglycerate-independent phosphoglycerate mutase [Candidatus Micrarchaeota archaeon]|nr:2,3-bisphosphoglycerate-independent phosphoglycerate mutase [Candidatus Micrarchaeota archaeon]
MKWVLVVLDGVGDLPHPDLNGKTPLQSARAPNLQGLARAGRTGALRIAKDVAPESDVGVCSVLGHNPFECHVGRGFLEAKGAGMRFNDGDLALRANFASVDNDGTTLTDRRAGRSLTSEEAGQLAKDVTANVKLDGASFKFKATKGHRGVLVIRAETPLDARVTNTDPAYEVVHGLGSAKARFEMKIAPCKPLAPAAKRAAELVNEFTRKSFTVLNRSATNQKRVSEGKPPGNAVLLRDPESKNKTLRPLPGRWAILSEMPMEEGIAKLMGMDIVRVKPHEGVERQYAHVADTARNTLKNHDGVYVHLKGPDVFGHDGDARGKKKSIEEIDAFFFKPFLEKLDLRNVRTAVTGDHSTPCILKAHSADPVPFLLSGAGVPAEGNRFEEKNPGPTINGWDFMPLLLETIRQTKHTGSRRVS